ncbi:MAG: hypothetical protein BWY89_01440 [Bacteroidetes bacterium ADurb.BinA012]|nr:MAG: hypothetical protein BWY89_01440 [Bacteroidetes bacterium ADurb.BinA012]
MAPCRVCKTPCINGIWPPEKVFLLVEIALLHNIGKRSLKCGHQVADEGVIACCLPCQPCSLDKPELRVSGYGNPDIFDPVLPLVRPFFGKCGKVIKDSAVARLVISKVSYHADQVSLGIAQSAHHVRVMPDPYGTGFRRPVTSYLLTINVQFEEILFQKPAYSRNKLIKCRSSSSDIHYRAFRLG